MLRLRAALLFAGVHDGFIESDQDTRRSSDSARLSRATGVMIRPSLF